MEVDLARALKLKLRLSQDTARSSLTQYRRSRLGNPSLDLPLEIRRIIYGYLFQPDSVDVTLKRLPHPYSNGTGGRIIEWDARGPAWAAMREWERKLFAISPIIYEEALESIYRPLRFHFGTGEDMRDFLLEIGPKARKLVAGVEVPYIGLGEESAMHRKALSDGIQLLLESEHLRWVKIIAHDYDLAVVGEDRYEHPASRLRGLKQVEIFRHVYLGRVVPERRVQEGYVPRRSSRGRLVDGEACARYWDGLKLKMLSPALRSTPEEE